MLYNQWCLLTLPQVSWCKFEVAVDCPKDISVLTTSTSLEVPPVVVAAVNLKTIINEKHNVHEIVSASVICCHRVKVHCSFGVGKYIFLAFDLQVWVLL